MAPRETENNAYAKFWGEKQRALWYVMVFSGVVNYLLACLAWRFWLGALSNKGGRGQRNCEEIGASPLVRPARQNHHATQANYLLVDN